MRFGETVALRGVDFAVRPGEIVALMGRNGAGKSSLLTALVGLVEPSGGTVTTVGLRRTGRAPARWCAPPGWSCRSPRTSSMPRRWRTSAAGRRRCRRRAPAAGCWPGWLPRSTTRHIPGTCPRGSDSAWLWPSCWPPRHPWCCSTNRPVGLDYTAKRRLTGILRELVSTGSARAVVLATHDVELVAELATRVVVIADGEVVSDGPTADVVVGSPVFAPRSRR